jgi:hypothetical protein
MRRVIGAVVLLAGCASTNEYVSGPPTTVREPIYSGQVRPRAPSYGRSTVEPAQSELLQPSQPPARQAVLPPPAPREPMPGRFLAWLRSGRSAVSPQRGPIRDEELDRAMVDTLTSGRPGYSRSPSTIPAPVMPETWVYPSLSPGGSSRSSETIPAGGVDED